MTARPYVKPRVQVRHIRHRMAPGATRVGPRFVFACQHGDVRRNSRNANIWGRGVTQQLITHAASSVLQRDEGPRAGACIAPEPEHHQHGPE